MEGRSVIFRSSPSQGERYTTGGIKIMASTWSWIDYEVGVGHFNTLQDLTHTASVLTLMVALVL